MKIKPHFLIGLCWIQRQCMQQLHNAAQETFVTTVNCGIILQSVFFTLFSFAKVVEIWPQVLLSWYLLIMIILQIRQWIHQLSRDKNHFVRVEKSAISSMLLSFLNLTVHNFLRAVTVISSSLIFDSFPQKLVID